MNYNNKENRLRKNNNDKADEEGIPHLKGDKIIKASSFLSIIDMCVLF